jgi:16S rRNA (cytidine1402-2'-O)-methyltransferase
VGTLYVVATPIGNLEDVTLRALRVLCEVDLIAAEDTRVTGRLLSRYDIETPLTSYHEHNKLSKLDVIFAALERGDVALVSDAGTPGLSDPGYELICEALTRGVQVVPIPGPSAVIAALVVSGLPTDSFVYVGFLPRRASERRKALAALVDETRTLVIYEAPHRLPACLRDALEVLGDRPVAVGRELTKLHEEIWRGTLRGALARFEEPPRGEVTLVIGGAIPSDAPGWSEAEVRAALAARLEAGEARASAARAVADEAGWPRRTVYDLDV